MTWVDLSYQVTTTAKPSCRPATVGISTLQIIPHLILTANLCGIAKHCPHLQTSLSKVTPLVILELRLEHRIPTVFQSLQPPVISMCLQTSQCTAQTFRKILLSPELEMNSGLGVLSAGTANPSHHMLAWSGALGQGSSGLLNNYVGL